MEFRESQAEIASQQESLTWRQSDGEVKSVNLTQSSELDNEQEEAASGVQHRESSRYSLRERKKQMTSLVLDAAEPATKTPHKTKEPNCETRRGKPISKYRPAGVDLRSSEHWGILQAVLSYTKSNRTFKHEATLAENVIFGIAEADAQGSTEKLQKVVSNLLSPSSAAYCVSQFCLGYCYLHGLGLAIDTCQAVSCFASAADKEYAPAQWGLAFCLEFGVGVPRMDFSSAVILLTGAVNQGFQPAAHPLSHLLAVMPLGALLS